MAEEKDYQRAMALEREANDARIRELEAENAVLKNRFDKYDIPDAELDKILVALPDLKAQAKAATDSEIREALLKIDLALEALAVNLKIARAALARKDAALAAADKKIITARALAKDAMLKGQLPENEHAIKLVNADIELREARALIAAALKEEEVKK